MAKVRNLRIYQPQDALVILRQEYLDIGFDVQLDPGVLTVFALRRKKVKKKDEKPVRNKRAEKHA